MRVADGFDPDLDELVASIIDTRELPSHLGPRDLLDADVVPPHTIARSVYALRELVRSGGYVEPLVGRVADSQSVARHFGAILRGSRTESIWIVFCDARLNVHGYRCVARGGVSSCSVTMADVLRPVVINASHALLLVHPHPSGDPSPSAEDVDLTKRVGDAARVLGVRLLDHVIIGRDRHFSFLDAGLPLASR